MVIQRFYTLRCNAASGLRCHWRAAPLAIALLLPGHGTSAQAQQGPSANNEAIINLSDGSKAVLVRWAIGSPNSIAALRIPLPYAPLAGVASSIKDDPNNRQPFVTQMAFKTTLWDMSAPNEEKEKRERNNLVFGLIESIFSGSKDHEELLRLKHSATVRLESVRRSPYVNEFHLRIGEKESRFGLQRIGAIHNLGERTPVGLQDFYFAGDDPTSSSDFMLCSDEAVPDDPPPGRRENPGCQQWFALPELSATVEVLYRRRHLAEWREIKRRVRGLILSWKPSSGGPQQ